MAADNETRLLSKAIRDKDIKPLLERGIDDSWFATDENKDVFVFIRDHSTKYGQVPTAVTVKDNFPNYRILAVDDSIEYLVDQMVAFRRRKHVVRTIQDAIGAIDSGNDHEQALNILTNGIGSLVTDGSSGITDMDLTKDTERFYEEYLDLKNRPSGLLGIPTGFPTMDKATAGLQPGQLITIIAPPKTGKSVLALQVAVNAHEKGEEPLFLSFEMTNREQRDRHSAMRANISHARLTRGSLHPDEETRLKQSFDNLAKMSNRFILTDSITSTTVSMLAAKIDELKPSVVFVDGVYMMTDELGEPPMTSKAITNVTRALKKLAMRAKVPIIQSTQVLDWKMRKGQVDANTIGYSSSFHQDSDVIFALQRTEDDDPTMRILKIVASRNCGYAEVEVNWNWDKGEFKEF